MSSSRSSGARRRCSLPGTPRPAQQQLITIAAHWEALTGAQKRAWGVVQASAANVLSPLSPSRSSGYGLFVATNSLHLDQGNSVQPDAPASYSPPVPLQPVRCNVLVENNVTTITLVPNVPYTGDVVLYGAQPSVASVTIRRPSSYVVLGKLSGISASEDVSSLYLSHFHVPGSSYQISFKLVPVSAAGFRGAPLFVPGFSLAPGEELPEAFNPDRKKAKPKTQLQIA